MSEVRFEQICAEFSKIFWHDSKLLDLASRLCMNKPGSTICDWTSILLSAFQKVRLNGDCRAPSFVIAAFSKQTSTYWESYSAAMTLGPQGVIQTRSSCKKGRDKVRQFDLPPTSNPLDECVGFYFEMIPPGGQMIIFARALSCHSFLKSS